MACERLSAGPGLIETEDHFDRHVLSRCHVSLHLSNDNPFLILTPPVFALRVFVEFGTPPSLSTLTVPSGLEPHFTSSSQSKLTLELSVVAFQLVEPL